MKIISLLVLSMAALGQSTGQPPSNETLEKFEKFAWLPYRWILTNGKTGQSGVEYWQKTSSVELRGTGATLKGKDTLFVERLRILVDGNAIYYVAVVPENKKPVRFRLTDISSDSFVFENPEHDFPKRIVYQLSGKKLRATVAGNGKSIDYWFVREK